jgi:hypothetical protein
VIDRQRLIIMFVTNLRGPDAPALVHARVGEVASQAGLRVWHIVDPETCTRLPSRHFRPWRALDLDHQGRPRHLDAVVDGARVYDTARVMFLRGCLTQRQRTPAQRVR